MKKGIIFIVIIAITSLNIFCEKKLDVTFLMLGAYSKTEENIDFFNKKVPEILKNYLENKKPVKFSIDLAWDRSKSFSDWTAKTDISAYESGKILKTDFVIYGNITQDIIGYKLEIFLYNVNTRKNLYSLEKSSNEKEDLYSFLEKVSSDIYPVIEKEALHYLDSKITFKKLASFEGSIAYPVPIGEYLNIQIGAFYIETGFNLSYKLYRNNNLSIYIRGGARTGFDFLFYNPKKIEGYFYELNFSFPVYCILNIKDIICLLPGVGFSNFINIYQQNGVDGNIRFVTTYGPGISAYLDFEIPLKVNRNISLGMKNEFNFIFYPGAASNEIKPKFQYMPCFYILYKMEDW